VTVAFSKATLAAVAVASGLTAAILGAAPAIADPPQPDNTAEDLAGDPVPSWAPRKPAEFWDGQPVVWNAGWGGRWGVWIHDQFITLSSNPFTNGG
jgi:hypothetical protein